MLDISCGCLEGVWKFSGECLAGVLRVSQMCLNGAYGMSEWYVKCLDVSEGQVRTSQVRIGKTKTGQIRTGQDMCLAGVLRVSGGCYEQIELIHHIFWENRWWLHRKLVTLSHHT